MFGDERATDAVLNFLRNTKVGHVARAAPPEKEEEAVEERRMGLARPRSALSFDLCKYFPCSRLLLPLSLLLRGEAKGQPYCNDREPWVTAEERRSEAGPEKYVNNTARCLGSSGGPWLTKLFSLTTSATTVTFALVGRAWVGAGKHSYMNGFQS